MRPIAVLIAALSVNGAMPGGVDPLLAADAAQPWTKVCQAVESSESRFCIVIRELKLDGGESVASATIRGFEGQGWRSLVVGVPAGALLKAGIDLRMDEQAPIRIDYDTCLETACFGQLALDRAVLDRLRTGSNLIISTRDQTDRRTDYAVALTGLAEALDGPAVDQNDAQEKLNRALQRRIECAVGPPLPGHPCDPDSLAGG